MKTAIITGANSGIGKQTTRELANYGYRVVIICRNQAKAESARDEIISETGNHQVDILLCDLASMDQIKHTAGEIRQTYDRLDLLVNNAGILPDRNRKESVDGIERTLAVNHLAYFLLTRELMPLLDDTTGSRIVNVASEAHRYGEFNPENIQLKRGYSASKAYGNSKLFNIMFTWQLNKELADKDVTTYSLHPGVVNTNFAANSDSLFAKFFNLGRFFMKSPEKGAKTTVYLCTQPDIEHFSGMYFLDSKPISPSKDVAMDDDACERLWEISEEFIAN